MSEKNITLAESIENDLQKITKLVNEAITEIDEGFTGSAKASLELALILLRGID